MSTKLVPMIAMETVPEAASLVADFRSLSRRRLQIMRAAGNEIVECYRVLTKGGLNVVGEVLRGQGTFYEMNHYPDGDVFDVETHSQYYYHAHPDSPHEHGHFHTFLRRGGMPSDVRAVPYEGTESWPAGDDALAHLVAISMDSRGYPIDLFAVNRWVTGDTWYRAEDVIRMAERFDVDHAYPSWPSNRWISAMVRLFRPQVAALLRHRDLVVAAWAESHPSVDVYEDRALEVTGRMAVSVEQQIERVSHALRGRG